MLNSDGVIVPINWNNAPDRELLVWNKLTENFWLPEKVALSNDLKSWKTLTEAEKLATMRVFGGLTMLDTLQGSVGAVELLKDAKNPFEEAVFGNIVFMECLHPSQEVLTSEGWISATQVTEDTLVAQYNPIEDDVTFTKPVSLSKSYSDETYLLYSKNDYILHHVSENHRIAFQTVVGTDDNGDKVWEWATVAAKDLKPEHFVSTNRLSVPARVRPSDVPMAEFNPVPKHKTTGEDLIPRFAGTNLTKRRYFYMNTMGIRKFSGSDVIGIQVPSGYIMSRHPLARYSWIITGNCVHAKSYSSIFSTLADTENINETFRWVQEEDTLVYKARTINELYESNDPIKKLIAAAALESALFYSGFYLPLKWSSQAKLTNTADLIRLIIRDEAVHGYYVGNLFKDRYNLLSEEKKQEYKEFTYELFQDLYDNESKYTELIYDDIGWTEGAKTFVRYNFNKALQNLGFNEPLFPANLTKVEPSILSALNPEAGETHDFFSGSGSSYKILKNEETSDDDWD